MGKPNSKSPKCAQVSPIGSTKTFRSRKLDYTKALRVYREDEMDMEDRQVLVRSVPQVATGVDKEEEGEHHLKAIIENAPTSSTANAVIPIPGVEPLEISCYRELYPTGFQLPEQYIQAPPGPNPLINLPLDKHLGSDLFFPLVLAGLNSIGNGLMYFGSTGRIPLFVSTHKFEPQGLVVPFNLSESDQEWISGLDLPQLSFDLFEKTIWILECIYNIHGNEINEETFAKHRLVSTCMNERERAFVQTHKQSLFEYWTRKKIQANWAPLIATVLVEDTKGRADPFVCFRKRETLKQRKTRRSEVLFAEKISRIRRGFEDLAELVERGIRTDKLKKQSLESESKQLIEFFNMYKNLNHHNFHGNSRIFSLFTEPASAIPVSGATVETSATAKLFSLDSTYLDMYSGTDALKADAIFQSASPWATFFHPIKAAKAIDMELQRKAGLGLSMYREQRSRDVPDQFFMRVGSRTEIRCRIGRHNRKLVDRRDVARRRTSDPVLLNCDQIQVDNRAWSRGMVESIPYSVQNCSRWLNGMLGRGKSVEGSGQLVDAKRTDRQNTTPPFLLGRDSSRTVVVPQIEVTVTPRTPVRSSTTDAQSI